MKQMMLTAGLVVAAAIAVTTVTFLVMNRDGRDAVAAVPSAEAAAASSENSRADQNVREQTRERRRPGEIYTPAAGSTERSELMDTLRSAVASELGSDVIFKVSELKVEDDWAFAVLEPVHRDGSSIDIDATPLAREVGGADYLDGLRTEAVWRRTSNGWKVEAHGIGATDVWYETYCETAPRGLIAICDQQVYSQVLPSAPPPSGDGGMNRASIDRLTTYAVLLGRGVGCGIETGPQMARVGRWLDRVAPPGSSDQRIYLPMFMAGVQQNASNQAQGRSPDNCNTVARAISQHPWP